MDTAIHRYQNDPIFHKFTDAIAGFLERGFIDRDGVIDALRVAEIIAFNRADQHGVQADVAHAQQSGVNAEDDHSVESPRG